MWTVALVAAAAGMAACAPASTSSTYTAAPMYSASAPDPDPRVGLAPGLLDAGEAIWNMRLLSSTPPPPDFVGVTNSDLAFIGDYAIQGNYNGWQIWDISNPSRPDLVSGYLCPASQSDVSVYRNLLFISGEGLTGRIDCGTEGVADAVSQERLRGVRIFDISDIQNPVNVGNVQTCRGSHTHTILVDPDDPENVYIYISGSAGVRPAEELPGCSDASPAEDPNTALFRIEVIRVPLADPGAAAIVSSPRILDDLEAPPTHGPAPEDIRALEEARARGEFIGEIDGELMQLPRRVVADRLEAIIAARGGSGAATAADSAALRQEMPALLAQLRAQRNESRAGPTQCHDITVYPAIGLAGGACGGYGLLLDISDPVNPRRIEAVADENFSYWHSATFSNDGSKVLFTDEWGGGSQPKCRETDPPEWGANAIFTIEGRRMDFQSYYKLPAPQTSLENCVAHNGSLIPIPGREIMVQGWYQGGISIFDWTDPANVVEIAYHDRGPVDGTRMRSGGPWSVYWYNGALVSSEIARGLDIFELVPSAFISQNEIDAANTVHLEYLNPQGQPHFEWPASFALARAYADQLERSGALPAARLAEVRQALAAAESASGSTRAAGLTTLAGGLEAQADATADAAKVRLLATTLRDLATAN